MQLFLHPAVVLAAAASILSKRADAVDVSDGRAVIREGEKK